MVMHMLVENTFKESSLSTATPLPMSSSSQRVPNGVCTFHGNNTEKKCKCEYFHMVDFQFQKYRAKFFLKYLLLAFFITERPP